MVARRAHNPEVAGSTPAPAPKFVLPLIFLCACKVYLPMCQPSEDAPVGVTVHRVVEDDADGGTDD